MVKVAVFDKMNNYRKKRKNRRNREQVGSKNGLVVIHALCFTFEIFCDSILHSKRKQSKKERIKKENWERKKIRHYYVLSECSIICMLFARIGA